MNLWRVHVASSSSNIKDDISKANESLRRGRNAWEDS